MAYTDLDIIDRLFHIIESRRGDNPEASYTASLFADGRRRIAQKVGEEATETVIAAKEDGDEQLVYETADLWFHTLVMLSARGLGPDDVLRELERRFDVSGLEEKAARDK